MNPPTAPVPPESWLELPDGRTFWLTGRCAIGRQFDNDLVLDLPALSRRHALLTAEAGGYTLSDLHSRNGTFVNGAEIRRPVTLRDGDEIRFGDATARYRCTRRLEPALATPDFAATQRLDQMSERPCWLLLVDVAGYVYTLPTEAQWEYSCRAGETAAAPRDIAQAAWHDQNSGAATHDVATRPANAWGFHDIHGNVWEWCLDRYVATLPGGRVNDPKGPAAGAVHVRRGGSYVIKPELFHFTFRGKAEADYQTYNLGFRVALAPGA